MENEYNFPRISQDDLHALAHDNFERQKILKANIVKDWLPRYTGMSLEKFGEYILLVNFSGYVRTFADQHDVPIYGADRPMQAATADNITIINFGIG
ncbi:MAG: hypothetical protein ABIQ93_01010, partial [Saprospiraceae bacterium]